MRKRQLRRCRCAFRMFSRSTLCTRTLRQVLSYPFVETTGNRQRRSHSPRPTQRRQDKSQQQQAPSSNGEKAVSPSQQLIRRPAEVLSCWFFSRKTRTK